MACVCLSAAKTPDLPGLGQYERELSPEELLEKQLNTNFRIMEQIRTRVDMVVKHPKTAAALKPYYPYRCKRPTFHDEYLPTFNLPLVHLVDTAPLGSPRSTRVVWCTTKLNILSTC